MPLDAATLNRHLDKIVGDLPITVFIDGAAFTGTRGPISENQRLLLGGLEEKLAWNLYCKADAFGGVAIPGIGALVESEGVVYKIVDRNDSADGHQLLRFVLAFARRF